MQRKKPTHMDRQGQLPSSNDGCPCGFCDQRPALTNSSSLSLSRPNSHWNRESDAGWSHCQRPLLMAGRSECGSTKTLRTASASRAGLAPTPGHEVAGVLSRERSARASDTWARPPTWLSPLPLPPGALGQARLVPHHRRTRCAGPTRAVAPLPVALPSLMDRKSFNSSREPASFSPAWSSSACFSGMSDSHASWSLSSAPP